MVTFKILPTTTFLKVHVPLRELPALKFLYVQAIEDGKSFGSLQDEFGERIQIYYRALPLRYARDKIRSLVINELDKAGQYGWYFNEKALELYRGHFKHVSKEIHFYDFLKKSDFLSTVTG